MTTTTYWLLPVVQTTDDKHFTFTTLLIFKYFDQYDKHFTFTTLLIFKYFDQ